MAKIDMEKMFSENKDKQIPKDYNDCYKTDTLIKNLWIWCERLEDLGKWLCLFILIFGAFYIPSNSYVVNFDNNGELYKIFDFTLLLNGLFKLILSAFIAWGSCRALSLIVCALASIVQNTKITANINLLRYAQENNIEKDLDEEIKEENEENTKIKNDEKIEKFYKVKLIDDGNDPILIRNEISKLANITLSNAQKVVDLIPNAVLKFKSFETANEFCKKLRSLGATVELIGLDESDVEINQDNGKYEKIQCPYCFEKLEFLKGTKNAQCPYCNKNFTINT